MYGFEQSRDHTESAMVAFRAAYYKMCCHTVGCKMRYSATSGQLLTSKFIPSSLDASQPDSLGYCTKHLFRVRSWFVR
jgi:hypothetical protein